MRVKLQFMLSKFGIAWMFALVTINYNRVAIYDLGISAALVATMIGLYPFFGPLQPLFGRVTSRYPILGYRRSPYLLLGMLAGSLVFPPLPAVTRAIAGGSAGAVALGFGLFFVFGASIALMANTYLDLVAECTTEATRGGVFAAAWTGQTAIIVVWALIFRALMPTYSPAAMQLLYNLTPPLVMALALLSVLGLERRLAPGELARLRAAEAAAADAGALRASLDLLLPNPAARRFFTFIALSFLGIFLTDTLQEVAGGELFGMSVGETTVFQQIFNGTVTVGMALAAIFGARLAGAQPGADGRRPAMPALPLPLKRRVATIGGAGATAGLLLLALASALGARWLVNPAWAITGLCVGLFTMAAVTMMSEMTVAGQTGRYLGLWSLAQAIGLGSSFILSGLLHDAIIRSGLLAAPAGYAAIFGIEAACMVACLLALRGASVDELRRGARAPASTAAAVAL